MGHSFSEKLRGSWQEVFSCHCINKWADCVGLWWNVYPWERTAAAAGIVWKRSGGFQKKKNTRMLFLNIVIGCSVLSLSSSCLLSVWLIVLGLVISIPQKTPEWEKSTWKGKKLGSVGKKVGPGMESDPGRKQRARVNTKRANLAARAQRMALCSCLRSSLPRQKWPWQSCRRNRPWRLASRCSCLTCWQAWAWSWQAWSWIIFR